MPRARRLTMRGALLAEGVAAAVQRVASLSVKRLDVVPAVAEVDVEHAVAARMRVSPAPPLHLPVTFLAPHAATTVVPTLPLNDRPCGHHNCRSQETNQLSE